MINNVVLIGRITRDPELRKTQNGKSVLSFSIAVNRKFKTDNGPDADFINVTAWNHSADFVARYVTKGDLLGVEGRIETSTYQDKDDRTVYKTEVIADSVQALESKKEKESRLGGGVSRSESFQKAATYEEKIDEEFGGPTLDITSDDLPF